MRLTKRNYYGVPYVPGYAPKCRDSPTCELIMKLAKRLALFEDMSDKYMNIVVRCMADEDICKLKEEGIL